MKRSLLLLTLPATLALSACATDGYYGGGVGFAYAEPYGYDGFYDGYYGPIYDGYWGNNGYFYYRSGAHDRYFRRGDHNHFYRGDNGIRPGFNPMHGSFQHSPGMRTPSFPRAGRGFGGPRGDNRGGRH